MNSYVHILNCGWLYECFSYKRLVNEKEFEINVLQYKNAQNFFNNL